MKNLAQFIRDSTTEIVDLSVEFARTLGPLSSNRIDIAILHDHLPLVLDAIANDLDQPQTRAEGIAKSKGDAPQAACETAAQAHGRMRADSGLTIEQLVSEYRVLRATVTRLWLDASGSADAAALADLVRFNEAIDQAVAESVTFYSSEIDHWRAMLLAVVGHDLREPLNTIHMTTDLMARTPDKGAFAQEIGVLQRGAHRLRALLDSLLEYSNARLGARMDLDRREIDVEVACCNEVELLRSAFPAATINVESQGALIGRVDEGRLRQALSNLIANAVQYRSPGSVIDVVLDGRDEDLEITVRNEGPPLDQHLLDTLFEPLRRKDSSRGGQRRNLGLGLFIVKEIAMAHHGSVSAESKDGKIAFTIRIPRH